MQRYNFYFVYTIYLTQILTIIIQTINAERLPERYLQQDCGGIKASQECDGADADGNGEDGGARIARKQCEVGLRKHSDCGAQEGAGGADKGDHSQAWD